MANIEDISGVYGGVNVGNNTQPIEEKSGVYNTTNFNNELNSETTNNVVNSGVYGNVETNENVTNTGVYGNIGTDLNNNSNSTENTTNTTSSENADNLITVGANLPAKTGFWNKVKAVFLKEIKVELNPYEQKIEKEINDFLHQEITWQKVKNFLFQDISFGKKKSN